MPPSSPTAGCSGIALTPSWTAPTERLRAPTTLGSGRSCSISAPASWKRPRDQAHMPPVRITLPGGILLHRHLDTLRELCPQRRFEVWRSRPNVLVQTTDGVKDFVENGRIGHTLAMGARVRLSITGPCPRCVITSVVPSDLPRHPGICAPRPRITRSTLASTRRSYAAAWSAAVMRSGWSGTGYR
jgi:uncharacterized protein YcbX